MVEENDFHSSACSSLVFPTQFIEEIILSHLYIPVTFITSYLTVYRHGFISGLSFLFHSSWHLLFHHYHTVWIAVTLLYCLISRSLISSTLLFSRTLLATQGLLWLHLNFRIICFSSLIFSFHILMGIALNMYIILGSMAHLTVSVHFIHENVYLSVLTVLFNLFFSMSEFSKCSSFTIGYIFS